MVETRPRPRQMTSSEAIVPCKGARYAVDEHCDTHDGNGNACDSLIYYHAKPIGGNGRSCLAPKGVCANTRGGIDKSLPQGLRCCLDH